MFVFSSNIPMAVTNESTPLHTATSKSTRVTLEDSSEAAGGYPQDDVIKLEANGHVVVEGDPDDDDDEAPGKFISVSFGYNWNDPRSHLGPKKFDLREICAPRNVVPT